MAPKIGHSRKRILFLTPQLPYPPQQGTAIRNYNLIRQVAVQHEVHLLSFAEAQTPHDESSPLQHICKTVSTVDVPQRSTWNRLWTTLTSPLPDMHHRLASATMRERLESLLGYVQPDIVEIEGLEMAQYGLHIASVAGDHGPEMVFDAHNAEYLLQRRIFETDSRLPARWPAALYSWIQWQKLQRYEAMICRRAKHVLACSAADAQALAQLVPGLEATVVPNGVDTHLYRPGVVKPAALGGPTLVFTGKMDFRPNVDAVLWFVSEVLPLIQRSSAQAHFFVVGKNPHPRLIPLAQQPGITLTGFVEDVRPYIAAATVYVVPLLTGGGTRLKVLEAMSMGKAIVSTSLGCEGIHATAGRNIVLADDASNFSRNVLALFESTELRDELGRAAQSFAAQHFAWPIVTRPLEHVYGA